MDENEHRLVMAELDALKQQVASTIQKFEATGFSAILKDDYVALHVLEQRIMDMYCAYARALRVWRPVACAARLLVGDCQGWLGKGLYFSFLSMQEAVTLEASAGAATDMP